MKPLAEWTTEEVESCLGLTEFDQALHDELLRRERVAERDRCAVVMEKRADALERIQEITGVFNPMIHTYREGADILRHITE